MSVLEYLGLTLITTFPCFAARYSIFKINSPQLASDIERFKPFFLDCWLLRNLPVFSSIFNGHRRSLPEIFKFSRINRINIFIHYFVGDFPLIRLTLIAALLMKKPEFFSCFFPILTLFDLATNPSVSDFQGAFSFFGG
jgi:hypothetical protein